MIRTPPLSVEDIHEIFVSSSRDVVNSVLHIDVIEGFDFNLDKIFQNRYSIILFLPNPDPNDEVGHFVLITHLDNENLEYFDSFGNNPQVQVEELARRNGMKVVKSSVKLQNEKSFICGKYCILRLRSLPTPLNEFIKILSKNEVFSPDQLVDKLIRLVKQ